MGWIGRRHHLETNSRMAYGNMVVGLLTWINFHPKHNSVNDFNLNMEQISGFSAGSIPALLDFCLDVKQCEAEIVDRLKELGDDKIQIAYWKKLSDFFYYVVAKNDPTGTPDTLENFTWLSQPL